MVTLTTGAGAGAKARVGLLPLGAFVGADLAGLRGGEAFAVSFSDDRRPHDICVTAGAAFGVGGGIWINEDSSFHRLRSRSESADCGAIDRLWARDKVYSFDDTDNWWTLDAFQPDDDHVRWDYCTQIEAAVGVGPMLRVAVNAAESVDFLCGWFIVDPLHDDIAGRPRILRLISVTTCPIRGPGSRAN